MIEQLSVNGWLDGSTALAVVLAGLILGSISFYKAIRLKAKLLSITGITIICIGNTLLGPAVDFLFILITTDNLSPYWLYGLLCYVWTGPLVFVGFYVGGELMMPKRKWILLSIYGVGVIIFDYLIFFYSFTNPEAIFNYPVTPPNGTALLNTSVVRTSIIFILMITFLVSGLIFNGFGFLRKAIKASGEIKRKFYYLSFGWIIFILCGALDALLDLPLVLFVIRTGTIVSVILLYFGVRVK